MIPKKPILLVEDNPDDQLLAVRALKSHNILNEVKVMSDGVEALEYLFGSDGTPDKANVMPQLILLDINLPRISGLEVLRELRAHERTKLLPVVILTSSREDQDLVESYELGVNSYIRKPVDFIQFSDLVRQLGFYWLVLNEVPDLPNPE